MLPQSVAYRFVFSAAVFYLTPVVFTAGVPRRWIFSFPFLASAPCLFLSAPDRSTADPAGLAWTVPSPLQ